MHLRRLPGIEVRQCQSGVCRITRIWSLLPCFTIPSCTSPLGIHDLIADVGRPRHCRFTPVFDPGCRHSSSGIHRHRPDYRQQFRIHDNDRQHSIHWHAEHGYRYPVPTPPSCGRPDFGPDCDAPIDIRLTLTTTATPHNIPPFRGRGRTLYFEPDLHLHLHSLSCCAILPPLQFRALPPCLHCVLVFCTHLNSLYSLPLRS